MELKIIAILAGVFAAIGLVMFGRSKDETQASKPAVELVERAQPVETPPPLLTEPIADPVSSEILETPVEPPVETPMPVAAFKAASQARAVAMNKPAVNESATPAVRSAAMDTVETSPPPQAASPQVAPYSVKQDPARPETPALQNLSQDILRWGESGQLRQLPKLLQYAKHNDPQIRAYIAVALGQIAAAQTQKSEARPLVAPLQQLIADADPKVQRLAKKALAAC
jgi:hypothetical protein